MANFEHLESKERNEHLQHVIDDIKECKSINRSYLMRHFNISYEKAENIMDALEKQGFVKKQLIGCKYRIRKSLLKKVTNFED